MSQSALTKISSLMEFMDEEGSESFLSSIIGENAQCLDSNRSGSASTVSRAARNQQELSSNRLRQRRGHQKSRNGCYNCKRRKIKCPENQPACYNCTKVHVECKYPPVHVIRAVAQPQLEIINLQSTPILFTSTDMRLFHHFLMNCYPHLPLGNEEVWVRDIPSFAHSYDFLMQAMLGLAASHLTMTSTSQLTTSALSHRSLAIKGLNAALSKKPSSSEESDAILAASMALALQTSYLGNSIEEFLTMLRGCTLLIGQDWVEKLGTAFQKYRPDGQAEIMKARLQNLPLIDQDLAAEAKYSFESLTSLDMGKTERDIYKYMCDIVELLSVSSSQAYFKYQELNYYLGQGLSHQSFQAFVDPSNVVAQVLLAHMVALLLVFSPIKSQEWAGRNIGWPNRRRVFRVDGIWNNVPSNMRHYLKWPMVATGSMPGVPSYVERAHRQGVSWVDNNGSS